MALFFGTTLRRGANALKIICSSRSLSYNANNEIKKSVFISQSTDIYSNLALEQWLYLNFDFNQHHVLLVWQNEPAVSIGKSQNPWYEVNVAELPHVEDGVKLARRNIDQTATYHDKGNFNLSFFTSEKHYDRRYNLEIIRRALFREFGIKNNGLFPANMSNNDMQEAFQSSSLVGDQNAYHHCNIFVDINEANMKKTLLNYENGPSRSTQRQKRNLNEINKKANYSSTLRAIGWEFLRTTPLRLIDGGRELANKQKGFQMINPSENWFPGITEIRKSYESWDWCFGETPEFSITRTFPVPQCLLTGEGRYSKEDLKITINVKKGKIDDVTLYLPEGFSHSGGFTGETKVITSLKGQRFSEEAANAIHNLLGGLINEKEKFVTDCVKQAMLSA